MRIPRAYWILCFVYCTFNNTSSSSSNAEPQKELTPKHIRAYLKHNQHTLASPNDRLLRVDVLAFCLSDAEPTQTESVSADDSTGSNDGTAATAGAVPESIKKR
jgi:hypothetical protein